jgi:Ku70/Ku80 beta-barrel domain
VAAQASWRRFLKIAEVSCPVALYAAASSAPRITFHTPDRATGHRLYRRFVDDKTGEQVETAAQVKGYEVGQGEFIACSQVDDVYFDRPYYLMPSDAVAEEACTLIREAMRARQVAALARTVLLRRLRAVTIRAHDASLIATTLNCDCEVRHRRADDRERFVADRIVRCQVVRLVVPDPADRVGGDEHLDVDRPRAFERHRVDLVVFEHDIFVGAALVSHHLLVLIDRLAGPGIHVLAAEPMPVARLSVWKRTFSLSHVAGVTATGQVTSGSFR